MNQKKPRIGIVVCALSQDRQFVSDTYIRAVQHSGGLPLILPLIRSSPAIASYVSLCDGFLFCGGNDITPLLFGQEPQEGIGKTDIALDLFQIRLMKEVLQSRKPVLAICRGMQILNVACGGTIYQDISLQPGGHYSHMQHSASRSEISHKITCAEGTLLYRILGPYLYVNSYHHQTVGNIGAGLCAAASALDGTIEAVEMPSCPFAVGVQWHPESMYRNSFKMRRLFSVFLQKCRP